MEHLYSFLSIFYYYKITPIFVFDGKPPPEKRALLKKRYAEKKEAETKYDELDDAMMIREEQDESDQYQKMNELCKKMVRIKSEQLKQTKDLMSAFGYTYIQSAGEADRICVQYVLQGKAWACLSDDMDMLLLGCPRIFRNLYTQSHTWILYESASIFAELGISRNKMVETLVSKGATDYYSVNDDANCNAETQDNNANANKNINLTQVLDHLRNKCESEPEISEEIHQICSLFEIQENMYEGEVQENAFNIEEIQRIMSPVGFVFI
jgi:hypothetical protein